MIRTFQINGQHGRLPRDIAHTTCNTLAITNGVYSSTSRRSCCSCCCCCCGISDRSKRNCLWAANKGKWSAGPLRGTRTLSRPSKTGHVAATMLPLPLPLAQCGHPNPNFDLHMTNGESAAYLAWRCLLLLLLRCSFCGK